MVAGRAVVSEDVPDLGSVARGETLADQAYKKLARALMTGTLSPGEKVTVRRIASALGVSLTPAREAIGRLAAERALTLGTNRAVIVPILTKQRYQELMQIRLLLEGLAAEKSLPQFDAERLEKLAEIQSEMLAAIKRGDPKTALARNEDFHFHIYSACEMPTLLSIIESLWLQVGPSMNLLTPDYQRSYQGSRNHQAAISAIGKRDAAGLRAAIEKDLSDGAKHLACILAD